MTEPYLIAHKVRGEPAFDIAVRMQCPECNGDDAMQMSCGECDYLGYWWIVSTSGHRAYPFNSWSLDELFWAPTCDDPKTPITDASEAIMNKDWSDWPDHYRHGAEEKRTIDVSSLTKPKPFKMNRRI